jgi:hypothetical protein
MRSIALRLALRARTQGFEPPGMDGAVCKAMMLRIVTPGTARAYQDATKVMHLLALRHHSGVAA